jgi:bacteriocin biosynthesis cyclodehydratase domain-containing protein
VDVVEELPNRRPLLKTWYRVVHEENRLLLEYGHSLLAFEGRAAAVLLPRLLPLLDGTRTIDDVVNVLGSGTRAAVENAVALLDEHQLLTSAADPEHATDRIVDESIAFLAATGFVSVARASTALRETVVSVVGAGAGADETARLLRLSGLEQVERRHLDDPPGGAALAVVCPSPAELPRLLDWNTRALESETPWLQLLPFDGRLFAVGPLYVPGETACYNCYLCRRLSHSGYDEPEFWAIEREASRSPEPVFAQTASAALATGVVLSWVTSANPFLPGILYALEWGRSVALTQHTVYRVPRCPACSGLDDLAPPNPWYEEPLDVSP